MNRYETQIRKLEFVLNATYVITYNVNIWSIY